MKGESKTRWTFADQVAVYDVKVNQQVRDMYKLRNGHGFIISLQISLKQLSYGPPYAETNSKENSDRDFQPRQVDI